MAEPISRERDAAPAGLAPRRPSLLRATLLMVALAALGLNLLAWARFVNAYPDPRGYVAQTDFPLWFAIARLIAGGQGDQLFNVSLHQATQAALIAPYQQANGGLVYHYWPILGGLLLPVSGWPIQDALAAWVVVSAIAFTIALLALIRGLRFGGGDSLLFGLAAWGFLPHIVDLEQGQTSNLLCLPLALGLLALRWGADWPAGLALGLLCLKPQLLPVWVVALLAARRWRALAGLAVAAAVLAAISTVLAGPGWIADWINLSREAVSATSGHGFDAAYSHNFRELIGLIPGVGPAGANTAQTIQAVVLAAVVALFWWRTPAAALPTALGGRLFALTILAMLLATPVLNTHDLTFWVVAAAFLLAPSAQAILGESSTLQTILCWIGWLVPWPAVALLLSNPIKPAAVYMLGVGIWLAVTLWREAPGGFSKLRPALSRA